MAINKVDFAGTTLIDLTADTVDAEHLAKGYKAHNKAGEIITGIMEGGGLPSGIQAFDFGQITISTQFTTSRQTFKHNLGVVPDLVFVWHNGNISQTYSMLFALKSAQMTYRSGYNQYMAYHANSTSNVSQTYSSSTTYGISNMTATTFQLASASSSYYWRTGTYNYIAIKFA